MDLASRKLALIKIILSIEEEAILIELQEFLDKLLAEQEENKEQ